MIKKQVNQWKYIKTSTTESYYQLMPKEPLTEQRPSLLSGLFDTNKYLFDEEIKLM